MQRPSWMRSPAPGPTQVADTIIIAVLLFGFLAGTLLIAAGAFGRGNAELKAVPYVPAIRREQFLGERDMRRRSLARYQLQRSHTEARYGTTT